MCHLESDRITHHRRRQMPSHHHHYNTPSQTKLPQQFSTFAMRRVFSLSVLLIVLTNPVTTAFVVKPHQRHELLQPLTFTSQHHHDINFNSRTRSTTISNERITPKHLFSFAIYSNKNTDSGVIMPEDGFGSPCVIKVRFVSVMLYLVVHLALCALHLYTNIILRNTVCIL